MPKKVFRVMYALNYVTQAAFCLLCPAGLLILGGWFLTNRCGVGKWAMIVAIVLGVLTGGLTKGAAGIAAAIFFSVLAALVFRSRDQS